MMPRFADLPFRRKLILVITGTSVLSLLLACVGFIAAEASAARRGMAAVLSTRALMLADNSAAALTFRDPEVGAAVLATLDADPRMAAAGLYAAGGTLFASFTRPDAAGEPPAAPPQDGVRISEGRLRAVRGVHLEGRRVGTIYLAQDLTELYETLARLVAAALCVLLGAGLAAFALARRFERLVSGPLLALTETARAVSERGDYSLRAAPGGRDELGTLTSAFNGMLDQIAARDAALRETAGTLERRVAERTADLAAMNGELEAFSYSVAHDLRAPLRHIDAFLKLLSERLTGLDAESRRHMDVIASAAKRMGAMIDGLIGLARTTRAELERGPVDLRRLAEAVRAELTAQAPARAVEWRLGELPEVEGDEALLRVVLENLLGNAVKYTRGREPAVIEVGARREPGRVVVSVKDNGVGFDMRYAEKLWGAFQRMHRAEEFEGTGIGLASARRIVARHGGETWAEAEPGRGATFRFSLPMKS